MSLANNLLNSLICSYILFSPRYIPSGPIGSCSYLKCKNTPENVFRDFTFCNKLQDTIGFAAKALYNAAGYAIGLGGLLIISS